jgi:ABC-type uncharacterized transport system substrate-binding protein
VSGYRIQVLSSYIYGTDIGPHHAMGKRNRWFHGFVASLIQHGSSLQEMDVKFDQLGRSAAEVSAVYAECKDRGVELAICAGTDSAVRWAHACKDIPTLYFGAHPENNGLDLIRQSNIAGVRLHLPLVWSFENFSLLSALLPRLRAVYLPINLLSEFAFPNVRAAYAEHRRQSTEFWIPGTSSWVGHRSVQFLCERLGCKYYEGPYESVDELLNELSKLDPRDCAFVGFNDTVLMEDAANRLLDWSKQNASALFWVNNWPIIAAGGVADFSSHFEKVGRILGTQAMALLRGEKSPQQIGFAADPGQKLSLNLRRCAELSLEVSSEVRRRFDVVQD